MITGNVSIKDNLDWSIAAGNPRRVSSKIIEKWGTGIPRLFETCREYGLLKPELIDFEGDFRVNMYRKRNTNTETSTKTDREIINTDTETILRLMKKSLQLQPK